MKTRTKRIWAIVVCAAALLGWGVLHLANISRRLASEGVETGAVLTSSFTRRVQHGSGAGRHRNRAIRHEDVGYFSYTYSVGGENYEGEVRRTGPLVRARVAIRCGCATSPMPPHATRWCAMERGTSAFHGACAPDRGSPDGRNDLPPGEKTAEKRKFLALGL